MRASERKWRENAAPAAYLFDCDGVLVDSEHLVSELESQIFRRWGWDVSPEELRRRFKGKSFGTLASAIVAETQRLPEQWMYEWAMATAVGFREQLRAVTGVHAVVRALSERRARLAVVSQSAYSRVRLSLSICELDHYFGAHVYTASMVERPKPAPDLYFYAAAELGVEPERCIVVEDSESGVRAAVAAGMRVFGYAADEPAEHLQRLGATPFATMEELGKALQTTAPRA